MRRIYFIIYLLIIPVFGSFGQELDSLSYTNMRHGVLGNGLTYYIVNNRYPENSIVLQFIDRAGNFCERGRFRGISHLIEHLGFRSTTHFPNGIMTGLQGLGLKLGVNASASTTFTTVYKLNIPSRDPVMLDTCLRAIHDWANGLLFRLHEVEQERAAVVNETLRAKDSAFFASAASKFLLLDRKSEYASRIDSVNMYNVMNTSIDSIKQFYKTWYTPDRQAIIVVGDIDELDIENRIRAEFSDLVNNGSKMPSIDSIYKAYDTSLTGRNKLVVVDHGSQNRKIEVTIFNKRKRDFVGGSELKASIVDGIYSLLMEARLRHLNRDGELPWLSHEVQRGAIHPFSGIDALVTRVQIDKYEEVKYAIETAGKELYRIKRWGFSEREVNIAKVRFRATESEWCGDGSSLRICNSLSNAFNESVSPYFISNKSIERIINEITASEINVFAKKWLSTVDNIDILLSVPGARFLELLDEQTVFSWLYEVEKSEVLPYSPPKIKPIPEPRAKGVDISYRMVEDNQSGIVDLTLANGVRVVMKQINSHDNQQAGVYLKGFGGISFTRTHGYSDFIASRAAQVVTKSGIGTFSMQEFDDWKRERNSVGHFGVGMTVQNGEFGFEGSASLNNFEDMLRLVYFYYTSPQSKKEAYLEMVDEWMIMNGKSRFSFQDSIDASLGINHGSDQSLINSLKFNDVNRVYKSCISNLRDITFLIVGQFRPNDIIPATVRYLGALPASRRFGATKRGVKDLQRTNMRSVNGFSNRRVHIVADSSGNEKVRLVFPTKAVSSDEERLNLMVLAELIQSSLFSRLREREKAVYYVNTWVRSIEGNLCLLEIEFETLPENRERLVAATLDEITRLSSGDLEERHFLSSFNAVAGRIEKEQDNLGVCASILVAQIKDNARVDLDARKRIISKISLVGVRKTMSDLFDANNYFLFTSF
jgi:zinc protease